MEASGARVEAGGSAFTGGHELARNALGLPQILFCIVTGSAPLAAMMFNDPLGGLGFVCGERVELYRELRHQRAASRRRTSAQGIVLTAPLSSSVTRRVTSVAQAASASSSTSASRLSSNEPAIAARASVGSARASFRISAASRFMTPF